MSEPRQHHFIPAFYLAGFTDTGTRDGTLYVYDYPRHRHYSAKPDIAARERDFYRVYEPNEDPNIIERDLARVESDLTPLLVNVLATGNVRSGHELSELLSLVALIHARGPKARRAISLAVERTMRTKFEAGVVTPDQWETMVAAEVRAGVDPNRLSSYDEAVRLVAQRRWYPQAPNVLKTGLMPEAQQVIFAVLAERKWSLARADAGTGGFICSDTPLAWCEPGRGGGVTRLDDPSAVITCPLSKDFALITRQDRQGTYRAEPTVVGWVNARTMFLSMGILYAAGETFLLTRSRGLAQSSDYFAYLDAARRRGILNP